MTNDETVAIELFHGRVSPDDDLEEWGKPGPVFLSRFVHATYRSNIKLGGADDFSGGILWYVDDLIYYDGVFYGDWSVFPTSLLDREPSLAERVSTFDPRKAVLPKLRRLAR